MEKKMKYRAMSETGKRYPHEWRETLSEMRKAGAAVHLDFVGKQWHIVGPYEKTKKAADESASDWGIPYSVK